MPLKQGYADVWAASPFLVGLPLSDEPMRPYRRAHFQVVSLLGSCANVAIRLFRYPQAPHFILAYLFRKTWLVAKSYGGSLCFSYTINQKILYFPIV
ncbi:hypothetical protein BKP57_08460 [Virgibacillus sp. 6R]|uniref:Uncharacterized protein n=1 Tax=Virgibacillus pantothenticus TaxID=1473 RepID=A0A0L0QSC9_VIRPA|nr:hypothetical protein BKP57_08460 [Virgibacillus sp. 6R]KNE21501.1 hypothetical protein AFK71_07555 [Virgibacillus pantothenticus]